MAYLSLYDICSKLDIFKAIINSSLVHVYTRSNKCELVDIVKLGQ